MTPIDLRNLGATLAGKITLAENTTTTANFDGFVSDLKRKLRAEESVLVQIRAIQNGYGAAGNVEYTFKKVIKEEAIEVKAASAIWSENKDSSKKYISNTVYFVKKLDGGEKYEVTTESGNERKPFATLSKVDLDKSFTELRANQTPDAEGYTKYRDLEDVEAFKYASDTVKVDETTVLSKGDYLMRKPDGDQFVYEVKKAKDFEAEYTAH